MFVVDKNGEKLSVDNSKINYDEGYHPIAQTVGLYEDNIRLKPVWIVGLYVNKDKFNGVGKIDLELITEIKLNHKPTENEILYQMSANGLSFKDIVITNQGYELDEKGD